MLQSAAEILAMPNNAERLEHVRAKQLVTCLYLKNMTIGNRQKTKSFVYAMYFSCKCNVSKILALVVILKFEMK